MKKTAVKILTFILSALVAFGAAAPLALSAQSDVDDVISQLEAIDTLAQMQSKKSQFTASGNYDASSP